MLEKEMREVLDPTVGQDVVGEMRREIHRMQLRHGELMRLQDKMMAVSVCVPMCVCVYLCCVARMQKHMCAWVCADVSCAHRSHRSHVCVCVCADVHVCVCVPMYTGPRACAIQA